MRCNEVVCAECDVGRAAFDASTITACRVRRRLVHRNRVDRTSAFTMRMRSLLLETWPNRTVSVLRQLQRVKLHFLLWPTHCFVSFGSRFSWVPKEDENDVWLWCSRPTRRRRPECRRRTKLRRRGTECRRGTQCRRRPRRGTRRRRKMSVRDVQRRRSARFPLRRRQREESTGAGFPRASQRTATATRYQQMSI